MVKFYFLRKKSMIFNEKTSYICWWKLIGTDTILKIAPEIMKKINLFFLILILLSLWTFSCQKEEGNAPIAPNEATIANLTKGMQNGILNIPAQMLYRDSKTLQFTLTGLFYSAEAYYENN